MNLHCGMKIFVTQLFYEASSFVPIRVNVTDFKKRHYLSGYQNVTARFLRDRDWITGVLDTASGSSMEVECGVCTACMPGGMMNIEAFRQIELDMIDTFKSSIEETGPPDIVIMLLHGANVVEGLLDPEGALVEKFKRISPSSVIGVTLDFHGNISEKLTSYADVAIIGKEYPHIDTYERGALCVELAKELVIKPKSLTTFRFPIPLLSALPNQATVAGMPFEIILKKCNELEKKFGIRDLAVSGGFAFGDCADVGMCLLATNGTYEPCKKALRAISDLIWQLKLEILAPIPKLETVWDSIQSGSSLGRVVVADVSDSPGPGGTADETHLLSKLITSPTPFVSAFHVDSAVVKHAMEIGTGNEGIFKFGTSLSHIESKILQVKAKVSKVLDYKYTNTGDMMHGATLYAGKTCVLEVANGLIIVTTERIQAYDVNAFMEIGIDISQKQPWIIAIKSTAHFRSSYTEIADQGIYLVDCGGWSCPNFENFNYKFRRSPLLPLEPMEKDQWDSIVFG